MLHEIADVLMVLPYFISYFELGVCVFNFKAGARFLFLALYWKSKFPLLFFDQKLQIFLLIMKRFLKGIYLGLSDSIQTEF